MGLIRFLLAISVVTGHINAPFQMSMCDAYIAVQGFFIISGFYMAMVYNNYNSKYNFWLSRYIRLYPVYFICTFIALLMYPPDKYYAVVSELPLYASATLTFTQLTLFFHDMNCWISTNKQLLHHATLLKQAWSLGIELSFYLLTPFIINSKRLLYLVIISSLCLKYYLYKHYLFTQFPFHFFFPTALPLFAMGALAYHYKYLFLRIFNKAPPSILLLVITLYITAYPWILLPTTLKAILLCIMLILFMSTIFNLTKHSILDKFIGDLSYPIYCSHLIIAKLIIPYNTKVQFFFTATPLPYVLRVRHDTPATITEAVSVLIVTIIFSIILRYTIELPITKWRQKFKTPHKKREA